ncbi:MAG: hypothetical protein RLY30_561 [Pseudomonadota bacterium]
MTRFIRHAERSASVAEKKRPAPHSPALTLHMQHLSAFALLITRMLEAYPAPEAAQTQDEANRQHEAAKEAAREASQQLRSLLDAQLLELSARGTEPERALAEDIQYLKVALADEVLLHSAWLGQPVFLDSLLEVSLFRTSRAGQEVIDRVDRLLKNPSPESQALAPLYLFAINLGFQGRLRPLPQGLLSDAEGRTIQSLKLALFRMVYHRDPEMLHSLQRASVQSHRVMSEQAYLHTLQNMVPVRSWRLSRSGAWMIGWAIALLLASQLGWVVLSDPLRSALKFEPKATEPARSSARGN